MSDEKVIYKQLGSRVCTWCFGNHGVLHSVFLDMEDTEALRREVRLCGRCKVMAIGEPVPPLLAAYFDRNKEDGDLPQEERITV